MNSGLQTSKDYLNVWHAYLDFLRRQFTSLTTSNSNSNMETAEPDSNQINKEDLIEEIRDSFQKAINQLYDCKYIYILKYIH